MEGRKTGEEREAERQARNEANRKYYASNKPKIQAAKKSAKIKKAEEYCKANGVDTNYCHFFNVKDSGKVSIDFDTPEDLKKFIDFVKRRCAEEARE